MQIFITGYCDWMSWICLGHILGEQSDTTFNWYLRQGHFYSLCQFVFFNLEGKNYTYFLTYNFYVQLKEN